MSDIVRKHELTDVGTRYTHLMDLMDGWLLAEDILGRQNPAFMTPADKEKLAQVKSSIGLLEKQIRAMSEYNLKVSRLGDLIDTTIKIEKMEKDPEWVSYEQSLINDKLHDNGSK